MMTLLAEAGDRFRMPRTKMRGGAAALRGRGKVRPHAVKVTSAIGAVIRPERRRPIFADVTHDTSVTNGGADTRRFLLDTNAFISLEPFDGNLEANLSAGAAFVRLCSRQGHRILVHPATQQEVVKGRNGPRAGQRIAELEKFEMVEESPIPDALRASAGDSPVGTNDYIDLLFLASLASNAAHYLVSDDAGLRRRAKRAGLDERVLRLADAAEILSDLEPDPPQLPPRVEVVKAYALDTSQPLFASIRADYDEFDEWFGKVQRDSDNRTCFVIRDHAERYLAIAIVKDVEKDKDSPKSASPVSKISTFKVDPAHAGYRYGELLLKAVMRHHTRIGTNSTFVEVLPSVQHLPGFLRMFGFYEDADRTKRGESVFIKQYLPSDMELNPLDFHVTYGPPAVSPQADIFVVPIRPPWHSQLFPDIEMSNEPGLFPEAELTRPWGNALRKAYLCNASTNLIQPGAALLFYQSGGRQRVEAVGVVEDLFRTKDAEQIISATAGRTVYSTAAIQELAKHRSGILAILFRHDRTLEPGWTRAELQGQKVFSRPPQSISIVKGVGAQWVHSQLQTERH